MNNYAWLIAGGAAATGVLSMSWGYIRSFWQQLASYIIVTCKIQGSLEEAITMYFWKNFRTSPYGLRTYVGWTIFVRPSKRVQLVAMETIGTGGKLFWLKWRPIWLKRASRESKNETTMGGQSFEGGTSITFLRGTFNLDELVLDATNNFNALHATVDDELRPRYHVKHVFGTDGKPAQLSPMGESDGDSVWDVEKTFQNRLLQWNFDELGPAKIGGKNALGQLALTSEAKEMVKEIERWKSSEDWYKDRGIPWRRGWLLYGAPGTGKTSIIRAIAEDFDLPIYVYHLSTLYDEELQVAWQKMQNHVPCIALIEDIDTIFKGRENIANSHLTFDCLLNCLDGVERAGGVFLAITTNCLDHLDSALGIPTENSASTRPGRLDCMLELKVLDKVGRQQLCEQILTKWPEVWDEIIEAGENETGAQFQGRCAQKALQLYWG